MDIPYTVSARPDTGLYNAKVGVWLFLASEVMLFGGLFSSYIFLRVGADYPWPVHELNVTMGFINTLVLIGSSVTVLLAWASIKLRKFTAYKVYMAITIACALTFMVIKSFEYRAKFTHYSTTLTDGTILTGHLPHGFEIEFGEVKELTLTIAGKKSAVDADPVGYVLPYIKGDAPKFKTEDGKEITLDSSSFADLRAAALAKAEAKAKADGMQQVPNWTIKLTPATPITFSVPPSKLLAKPSLEAKSISFRDGTSVDGKIINDKMTLEVDGVDLRGTPEKEKSLAWNEHYLGSAWKNAFIHQRDEAIAEFNKKYSDGKGGTTRDPAKSASQQKEQFYMHIESATPAAHGAEGAKHGAEVHAPKEEHGAAHAAHHPEVQLERKDVLFYSNFTPKLNSYYAIYFTLTGLHGLHVIAGALVLTYFLVCDGRRLREDPEHMANRVEVGGLFWHFVDLVWIFLFPLLYLL
jgi:heme/copper-type cytochrome/quinol oxidase subunit 3